MPPDQINPSITASIGQNQPNPLAIVGQFAGAQNALNQNALFQQTFRARQALGPIAQQSVGPDGQMDWAKYAVGVSTHPDTAWMAPDILNQIAQKKLLDAETMNAELTGAEKRLGITANIAAAAYKNPDIKEGTDLTSAASDVLAAGGIKDGNRQQVISWLTQMAPLKGAELKQRLGQFAMANEQGRNALSQINGQYDAAGGYNPDGSTFPIWHSPVTGSVTQAALPGALSAGPTMGAAALNAPGGNALATPSSAPPSNALAPALTPPAQPLQGQSGPQLGQMGPVRKEMLESVAPYQKDVDARQSAAQGLLVQMQQAQRLMKNFTPNGAASVRTELGRIASGMGAPQDIQDELANGSIADSQAAQKLLFGIGSQLAAQLTHAGGGRMAATMWSHTLDQGSPNINMNAESISKIMAAMREVAHVTDMERTHLYGRLAQPNYDITRVRNDWANTLNSYIDAREGQPQ